MPEKNKFFTCSSWLLIISFLICSILLTLPAQAMRTEWVQYKYIHYSGDEASDIAVDSRGNVYVAGTFFADEMLNHSWIKYDDQGTQQWEDSGWGPLDPRYPPRLALDPQDNVYLAFTEKFSTYPNPLFCTTIKRNADGTFGWYGENFSNPFYIEALKPDGLGNLYVMGAGGLVKYGPTGNILWEKGYYEARAIAVDAGYVYITGSTGAGEVAENYITRKIDPSTGEPIWTRWVYRTGSLYYAARDLGVDGQGNVYVTGIETSHDVFGWPTSILTVKYDPEGNEKWRTRSGGSYSLPAGLAVDSQGNAYVTGTALNPARRFERRYINVRDYYTVKFNSADGAILWEDYYNNGFNSIDEAVAIKLDSSGNLVVTGTCQPANYPVDPFFIPTSSIVTLSYSPRGQQRWVEKFEQARSASENKAAALAVSGGCVYVTGSSRLSSDPPQPWNWVTIKYAPAPRKKLAAAPG